MKPPYATFRFDGATIHLDQHQFENALRVSKICGCGGCLCCRAAEYQRDVCAEKKRCPKCGGLVAQLFDVDSLDFLSVDYVTRSICSTCVRG